MDYTVKADCSALVTEKTGLTPTDLDALLEVSKGETSDGSDFFRPYYVCAVLLDSALHTRKLIKGEGAEFDQPTATVQGFLDIQHAIDQAEGLTVPDGMEATYRQPTKVRPARSGVSPVNGRW